MVKSLAQIKHQREAEKWPFRSSTLMVGPPDCSLASIQTPRLRQCRFPRDALSFVKRLGGGLDGYCWQVRFGEEGPFVLKLFWDRYPSLAGFAPRLECRNAALLQIMEEAVRQGAKSDMPVLLDAHPETWMAAIENMESFSDEYRAEPEEQRQLAAAVNRELQAMTSMPRMRQCYGWINIDRASVLALQGDLAAPMVQVEKLKRRFDVNSYDPSENDDRDYVAIVYEYIEPAESRPEVVAQVYKFFWLAGFANVGTPLVRNWEDGVLLDLSDIASPKERNWHESTYRRWQAMSVLKT